MTKNKINLQDTFLNTMRKEQVDLEVYLNSVNKKGEGVRVIGKVIAYDDYTVLIQSGHKINMLYKHSISSMMPTKSVKLDLFDGIEQTAPPEKR